MVARIALRRGLTRVLIVISSAWVLFVLFVLPVLLHDDTVRDQQRVLESAKRHLQERSAEKQQPPKVSLFGETWSPAQNALDRDVEERKSAESNLKATATYQTWCYRLFVEMPAWKTAAILFGPPIVLYAAGALLSWVVAGFRVVGD